MIVGNRQEQFFRSKGDGFDAVAALRQRRNQREIDIAGFQFGQDDVRGVLQRLKTRARMIGAKACNEIGNDARSQRVGEPECDHARIAIGKVAQLAPPFVQR